MSALHNVDAERSVLGAVLLDNEALHRTAGIEPASFYRDRHAVIFEVMRTMAGQGEAIDLVTLENALQARGLLERAGGPAYVNDLTDGVPSAANVAHYAAIVRERAARRRLLARLQDVARRIQDDTPIEELAAEVAAAAEIGMLNRARSSTLCEAFEQLERYQEGAAQGTLPIDLGQLDLYAPAPDELVVVAGRPSIGKTALAVALADRIARRGDPVLFISVEMSGEALNLRRLAAATGIPMVDLRRRGGIGTSGRWDQVAETFAAMKRAPFHIVSGGFTPAQLEATIRAEHARRGLRAVFVDHLGLLRLPKSERRDLGLGDCTAALARATKDLGLVVFLLCQLNRGLESRPDRRPRLSDLRDSGRIEEDADAAWLLYREGLYKSDAGDAFEVIVGKNRNGPVGVAKLRFDEITGRFWEA